MASEAQVLANRRNAEKSTGPRTAEGKAASSQNAVKHGLLGRRDVISTEDPAEFDGFREQMLAELRPAGPMETVLAERIVSLSWRLKRAERMQSEVLDCLLEQEVSGSAGEADELGSFVQAGDLALGRAVAKDFANERALDRLLVYERRIESSLYRTMNELHAVKTIRRMSREEEVARQWNRDHNPVASRPIPDPRSPTPAEWSSCQTNPISGEVNEREIPCGEGGVEVIARTGDGKASPNPGGTIDFLPEAHAATMMGRVLTTA